MRISLISSYERISYVLSNRLNEYFPTPLSRQCWEGDLHLPSQQILCIKPTTAYSAKKLKKIKPTTAWYNFFKFLWGLKMSEHELLSPLKALRTHYILTIHDLITLMNWPQKNQRTLKEKRNTKKKMKSRALNLITIYKYLLLLNLISFY